MAFNLFKQSNTTVKNPFETNPWAAQQDYLKSGFLNAQNALDSGTKTLDGIGNFAADMNGTQAQGVDMLTGLGSGGYQAVGGAGVQAGMGAIGGFGQASQNAGALYGQAQADPTQSIISNAQQYANDPYLQAQIDASLGDVNKAFRRDVADINGAATASGNINSTRAGALEARAMDDAMDRGAAVSSSMRGQAYQSGLDRSMATNDATFNRSMAANEMIGNYGLQGFDLASAGLGTQATGAQAVLDSGSFLQGQQQAQIDGKVAKAQAPMSLVGQYMQTVGGNYGQSGYTSETKTAPSPFQQILGGATSLFGAGFRLPWQNQTPDQ